MTGELVDDYVVVKDQSEGSRIFGRGNYGYPRRGGGVDLDLVEATFLTELGRLKVERRGEALSFEDMFDISASVYDDFDVKFMVYRDLRNRGLIVKTETGDYDFSVFPTGKKMTNSRPMYMVRAFSVRGSFDMQKAIDEVRTVKDRDKNLLYAVVDDEGEVLYYKMFVMDPMGSVFPEAVKGRAEGRLVRDRVFVMDREGGELLTRYGFYGKSVDGIFQLSLIEACHLVGKGRLAVFGSDGQEMDYDALCDVGERIQNGFGPSMEAYSDLRERGLVVKAGFKYGTDFRVYTRSPDDVHARYLVQAMTSDDQMTFPEVSKTVRLSAGVKKEILFARVRGNHIDYLEFQWFKPGNIPGQ